MNKEGFSIHISIYGSLLFLTSGILPLIFNPWISFFIFYFYLSSNSQFKLSTINLTILTWIIFSFCQPDHQWTCLIILYIFGTSFKILLTYKSNPGWHNPLIILLGLQYFLHVTLTLKWLLPCTSSKNISCGNKVNAEREK